MSTKWASGIELVNDICLAMVLMRTRFCYFFCVQHSTAYSVKYLHSLFSWVNIFVLQDPLMPKIMDSWAGYLRRRSTDLDQAGAVVDKELDEDQPTDEAPPDHAAFEVSSFNEEDSRVIAHNEEDD